MISKEFLVQIYEESIDLAIEVTKIEVKWALTVVGPIMDPLTGFLSENEIIKAMRESLKNEFLKPFLLKS